MSYEEKQKILTTISMCSIPLSISPLHIGKKEEGGQIRL